MKKIIEATEQSETRSWLRWDGTAWTLSADDAVISQLAAELPTQIYSEGNQHLSQAMLFAKVCTARKGI